MTPAPGPTAPTSVVSTTQKQRIVVVAADAAQLDDDAPALRGLSILGHRVVLLWLSGEPGPRLRSFRARVPIRPPSRRSLRSRVRHVASTSPRHWRADRGTLLGALRADPAARRELGRADAVVAVGPEAWEIVDELTGPGRPLVPAEELRRWEELGGVWRRLARAVEPGSGKLTRGYARQLLEHIALVGHRVPEAHQDLLVPLVESLHHAGEYDLAHQLAGYLTGGGRPLHAGLAALAETSATGTEAPGLRAAARGVLAAADEALDEDDTDRAVDAATLALRLLFHRELHADGLGSPLVEEPDAFLADWRASRVGALLSSAAPRRPPLPRSSRHAAYPGSEDVSTRRRRVVVVPGSYPQFAAPVIDALSERADVRVVDLAVRPDLRGLGTRRAPVSARLRQALGDPGLPDYEVVEEMEAADAVFVDWADPGALATVMAVPEGVPLVLRVHSMDALSPWIHLLDWSRVDDLVVVSEPIRALVHTLVGDRLTGTRVHVVPNVVDPSRVPTHKTQGHLRRLLMVGWGQQVKDPSWALDVLGALRRDDPTWRLSLLGTDFPTDAVRSQRAYARSFWTRLVQDDVRGAVDFEGYTRDVAPHLAASGFVLSTSRRESFGLGLVEAAASGAVPVVRNWPIFAPLDGARSLFPAHWVVETVEEAAARISAAAQEPAWSTASEEARAVVAERFSSGSTRATFQELVLGSR